MQKTLLVTTDFPPKIGGVSEYLAQICTRLPSNNIAVLAQNDKDADQFDSNQHYQIIRDKFYSEKRLIWPKWFLLLKKVRQIIKEDDYKQILVGQILPIGTVALFMNLIFSIPYVVSTHAMDITILANSKRKTRIAKKILKNSEQVVTVSNFTKEKLIELGVDEDKIKIISPGTDIFQHNTDDFQENIKSKYDLRDNRIILTIGRIVERKGHLEVLKALPAIINEFPGTKYIITSDGPYKKQLEEFVVNNNLTSSVIFTGTVDRVDIPSFYRLADVFVMPTIKLSNNDVEGFGIVYLEANAFGKPVVAYNTGGVSDAIINNRTGILVEPKNPEEISKVIIELLSNSEYAHSLGEQGRIRAESEFTWDVRAEKFKEIL